MAKHRIFITEFSKVYPMYVQKAERKNRTKDEVDQVIRWLTRYSQAGLPPSIRMPRSSRAWCAESAWRMWRIR